MIGKAIISGDRVVVRRDCEVRNGDTVVARFDSDASPEEGEATLKTFKRIGGHVWLLPENSAYDPIPGDGATIVGRSSISPARSAERPGGWFLLQAQGILRWAAIMRHKVRRPVPAIGVAG
jgi:Peptidase S24-like